MKTQKDMRHISRIDQDKKHQHGWWVRIHRNGKMIHKFFSDAACRGKRGALLEAKKYRDVLLLLYPKPLHGNLFDRPNARNTSGVTGVNKTQQRKRGRLYDVWQAGWTLPDGRQINRKFAFSPDRRSEAEAKKLAIKARREAVALIKKLRLAKTEKRQALKATAKKRPSSRKKQ
jgi:hypothetical protein